MKNYKITHILPQGDIIQHEESKDCVCGVKVVKEYNEWDDQWYKIYCHPALDGREALWEALNILQETSNKK